MPKRRRPWFHLTVRPCSRRPVPGCLANHVLVAEHIGDEFQLQRDRAWLLEVRDRAERAFNGE